MARSCRGGGFRRQEGAAAPALVQGIYGFAEHTPETAEFDVHSFVYRARRPFHPERFHRFLTSPWPGILRARGHFWLATRPDWVGELSQAGALVRHQAMGLWWASVPRERWPDDPEWRRTIRRSWDPVYADRRQEIVFIGIDFDEAAIRAGLDACTIGDERPERFDPAQWTHLPDPFPAWRRQAG